MEKIRIAVLTDQDYLFGDLKRSEGNVEYVRIREIENIRGHLFDGYCVIGTIYTINNAHELISIIKRRLNRKP